MSIAEKIIESRKSLPHSSIPSRREAEEGGCGVVGFACSKRLPGRHILKAAAQMHNRGNGKGGGVMAIGLDPQQMGVPKEILETWYLLQIAYLDETCRRELEKTYIQNLFDVYSAHPIEINNTINNLELTPPVVYRYFVKPKEMVLVNFMNQTQILDEEQASDELVYQNSFKINSAFYASKGDKKAFVLSHGKNMFVFKIVGYAEQVVQYYKLENIYAHIWLAHQRYPTRGRVWHPGGAHPFVGLNEALVHNGDFANYYAITHYLTQFKITPLFLTDTEVAVLQFDLYDRVFGLSTEYIIEALAPTTEYDLSLLPESRQQEYDFIHRNLLHVSPDGPWFFIIGRNKPREKLMQLLAITDTSMLRPQVFALQEAKETIGLVGSEKQAIDAVLRDLSMEDNMFLPVADLYWNARGGSASDGGAFMFTITDKGNKKTLICTDKFGNQLTTDNPLIHETTPVDEIYLEKVLSLDSQQRLHAIKKILTRTDEKGIETVLRGIKKLPIKQAIIIYTEILNSQISLAVKPNILRSYVQQKIEALFDSLADQSPPDFVYVDHKDPVLPEAKGRTLVVEATNFPSEGENSLARFIVNAYAQDFRKIILYRVCGQRFLGCGFGTSHKPITIDIYGTPGDYLASGIANMEIRVHGDAQDQAGQIIGDGKLIIYGSVGQTFLYGAKTGEIYVRGNAAGRPLINAVGSPRVVINGTCLDYLAESFMAGNPLNGGGFVIINGITFKNGEMKELPSPYPGGNLFSLASGGAVYIRDPHQKLVEEQLNGGVFTPITARDWELIKPYLKENQELFGISLTDLLTVNGKIHQPEEVYRKITVQKLEVLS